MYSKLEASRQGAEGAHAEALDLALDILFGVIDERSKGAAVSEIVKAAPTAEEAELASFLRNSKKRGYRVFRELSSHASEVSSLSPEMREAVAAELATRPPEVVWLAAKHFSESIPELLGFSSELIDCICTTEDGEVDKAAFSELSSILEGIRVYPSKPDDTSKAAWEKFFWKQLWLCDALDAARVYGVMALKSALEKHPEEEAAGFNHLTVSFVGTDYSFKISDLVAQEADPGVSAMLAKRNWRKEWLDRGLYPFVKQPLGTREIGEWRKSREIVVFRTNGVSDQDAKAFAHSVQKTISELGLDLKVKYGGYRDTVAQMVEGSQKEGRVNYRKLSSEIKKSRGGQGKAVIFLTEQPVDSSGSACGSKKFEFGASVCQIPKAAQGAIPAIQKAAKHDTLHLLGFDEHHDEVGEQGYAGQPDCIASERPKSNSLCNKCSDAIIYFWKGLSRADGADYFKKI